MKTVRVVSLARNMPTDPPLHSYQILLKYKGIKVLVRTRMHLQTDTMLIAISPEPIGQGWGWGGGGGDKNVSMKSKCTNETLRMRRMM